MTRWRDTLDPTAEPSLTVAANRVTGALYWGDTDSGDVAAAASYLRAYRKWLGVKSKRVDLDIPDDTTDEYLLWCALEYVGHAARSDTPQQAAKWCRWAECYLRALWKRGQA